MAPVTHRKNDTYAVIVQTMLSKKHLEEALPELVAGLHDIWFK